MSTDPAGLDTTLLRSHLRTAAPHLFDGPLTARLISGGRSNLTYGVTTAGGNSSCGDHRSDTC